MSSGPHASKVTEYFMQHWFKAAVTALLKIDCVPKRGDGGMGSHRKKKKSRRNRFKF
jgi:hypothetical protein